MGYSTRYEMNTDDDICFMHIDNIAEKVGFNPFTSKCKWYDHDSDMKEYSSLPQNKNILFTLSGEGEENTDIWLKYYKAGKVQECRAKIHFDPFDENKLE